MGNATLFFSRRALSPAPVAAAPRTRAVAAAAADSPDTDPLGVSSSPAVDSA